MDVHQPRLAASVIRDAVAKLTDASLPSAELRLTDASLPSVLADADVKYYSV